GALLIRATAVAVDVAVTLGLCSRAAMRFFRPANASGFGATSPVRVEQYRKMRPRIDLVPAAPVLGPLLLHPRSLHRAPPLSKRHPWSEAQSPAVHRFTGAN